MSKGWIGVDMDRTLAYHEVGTGAPLPGQPIQAMVRLVRQWLDAGHDVRIFTARVQDQRTDVLAMQSNALQREAIQAWCVAQFGKELPVTNCKDMHLWVLFDDRAVHVEPNRGRIFDVESVPEELRG